MSPLNSSIYRYFRPPVIYLECTYLQHTTLRPLIYFDSSGATILVCFTFVTTVSSLNSQEVLLTELPFAATLRLPTVAEFEEDAASLNDSRDHALIYSYHIYSNYASHKLLTWEWLVPIHIHTCHPQLPFPPTT